MELFERFEQLSAAIDRMNREATENREIPYVRLNEYAHYCAVKTFLRDYTCRLHMPQAEKDALTRFCYLDTLRLRARIGSFDLYEFTFHFLKRMTYRTGNLDTPDDCVEKLDLDRLLAYREAREKSWRGEALTAEEEALLERAVREALSDLKEAQ